MYHQAAQISGTARQNRPSDPRTGRPNRKKDMQRQEQIRLLQLLVCLALFLTVFIGKGVFPDKMVQVRDNILTLISTDTFKPLTVGINIFNGYNMIEWQYLFAASLYAIVPVVILFIGIEKNLVGGLTSGGVKG